MDSETEGNGKRTLEKATNLNLSLQDHKRRV